MRKMLLLLPLAALLLCGCDKAAEPPKDQPQKESVTPSQASGEEYEVICGCALEGVGHCGEYIKVGEEYLELSGDLGLEGDMPFCGQDGLKAKAVGQVEDGKFHVTSFMLVK